MEEFIEKNYSNFTYNREGFTGLGFIENLSQNDIH